MKKKLLPVALAIGSIGLAACAPSSSAPSTASFPAIVSQPPASSSSAAMQSASPSLEPLESPSPSA